MNETTALTTMTEEQALAMLSELDTTPGGMENVKQEDVAQPPRLKISAQNRPIVTADGAEIAPGHIANSLTGEDYGTTIAGVFLRFMIDTRCMWPEQYNADNDPLCASNDGVMPNVSTDQRPLTDPQSAPCAECKYSKFGPDGEAPRCQRQRNFLLWLVDTKEPVLLTVKSTGLKFAKTLTNLAVSCNVRRSIWFTTQKVSNDKGTWYVMNYTKGEPIEPRLSLELHELKEELAKLVITADVDEAEYAGNGGSAPVQVDEQEELPF